MSVYTEEYLKNKLTESLNAEFVVHEKSIFLVCLPVMLYFKFDPITVLWFLHIATFSMMPLLALDQLVFPTVILTFIYLMLVRITIQWVTDEKQSSPLWDVLSLSRISDNKLIIGVFYFSTFFGTSLLLVGQTFIRPPDSLPFLFPLLISAYSCVHFVIFLIYFNYHQMFGVATWNIDNAQRVIRNTKVNKTSEVIKQKKMV